jgi:hypothetical protein
LREQKNLAALKEKEKEMKQEKMAERQVDLLEIFCCIAVPASNSCLIL